MSNRINQQPVFLLSTRPWRENSLRVEAFSRDYGRVSLLARSARTRGSELRGVLLPFVPVSASWYGREELKTLHRAEWLGGWMQPAGMALMSALYVNELVQKLTAREDPQPELFAALSDILRQICTGTRHAAALRCFEWRLLTLSGFAPDWQTDGQLRPVQPEKWYAVRPESPVCETAADWDAPEDTAKVQGSVLLALGQNRADADADWTAALRLTRLLLDFRLPEGIHSRKVLQQMGTLKQRFQAA